MPDPDRRTRIDETDAKAGSKEGVVRWVLLFSLGGAIIALTIFWITGAITQNPVESEMNVERRLGEQREAAEEDREGLAEQADLVAPGTLENEPAPGGEGDGEVGPNPR